MKKRIFKELLFSLLFVAAAAVLIGMASNALKPARHDYGAVWRDFLAEEPDSMDYLYLGSSYAYCDISPAAIEESAGLSGYCMAGPEQTMGISYWYLRECLRTQSPRALLIEGTALHFKKFQDYTQVNLAYMPMGLNRIAAAFTVAEPELRTGILFDLYFYHDRWREVGLSEVRQNLLPAQPSGLRGFTPVDGVAENMDKAPFTRQPQAEDVYEQNLGWLQKIVDLCVSEGITPVVIFHPTYSQLPDEWHERMAQDITAMDGALFFDLSRSAEDIGLDPMTDYFDAGHLNEGGAEQFSAWLGTFMRDNIPSLAK